MQRLLLSGLLRIYRFFLWGRLLRATHDPRQAQIEVLRGILRANKKTHFGKKYDFAHLRTIEEFQRAVPWHHYEALRPYIDEQERTGAPVLIAEPPVMYARTSGTTGKHKLIPITKSAIQRYRRQQRLLASLQHQVAPEAFHGKSFAVFGSAVEGHLASGRPYGSMSGYVYRTMPAIMRSRTVVPPSVLDVEDYLVRYQIILRLALAERDITYLGTANPSTYLRLHSILQANHTSLIASVASGKLDALDGVPEATRREVAKRLRPDPERAAELARLAQRGELTYANLWPNIRLLTTWTAGNCALALENLRPLLPVSIKILELGYISSEFRGTLSVDATNVGGLPLLQDNFYEFIARDDWESGRHNFLTLDQLEQSNDYYVFVTSGALYRYAMDDILSVTGFINRTPLLRFRQKGKGCTSITGEKLYESQLLEAVERISGELGLRCVFFLLLADEQRNGYEFYIEGDSTTAARMPLLLDAALGQINMEYGAKRDSGRLAPLRITWLQAGTGDEYVRHCIARGQREGQFKHIALQYRRDVSFPFERYARTTQPDRRDVTG